MEIDPEGGMECQVHGVEEGLELQELVQETREVQGSASDKGVAFCGTRDHHGGADGTEDTHGGAEDQHSWADETEHS